MDFCVQFMRFTVVRICILVLPLCAFFTFFELENKKTQLGRARRTFETNGVVNTGRMLTHVVGLHCRSQRLTQWSMSITVKQFVASAVRLSIYTTSRMNLRTVEESNGADLQNLVYIMYKCMCDTG
jgi:hypothetical protein